MWREIQRLGHIIHLTGPACPFTHLRCMSMLFLCNLAWWNIRLIRGLFHESIGLTSHTPLDSTQLYLSNKWLYVWMNSLSSCLSSLYLYLNPIPSSFFHPSYRFFNSFFLLSSFNSSPPSPPFLFYILSFYIHFHLHLHLHFHDSLTFSFLFFSNF